MLVPGGLPPPAHPLVSKYQAIPLRGGVVKVETRHAPGEQGSM